MTRLFFALALVATAGAAEPAHNDGASWPALHGDVQRSGFYPAFPRGALKLVWWKELWRELTGPRAEVIVGHGVAFMGTYAGTMHAWDAATGDEKWRVETGGPIGHSPALADGTLYFGSMDRTLRAVEAVTGRERWRFTADEGVWCSPLVWQNRVIFGDRAGVLHILDAANGKPLSRLQTGDRIVTSASISSDGERIVFASEDMHVYCVRVSDGVLLWKSRKLPGLSVRDYAPLIIGDLAIVTTNTVKDFHTILDEHQRMLVERTGFAGGDPRYIPGGADDVRAEQDGIVRFLQTHPEEQTFHAFRVSDGSVPWIAPILYTGGLHNPPTPPCVNRETGEVFVQLRSAYGTWDGGGEVRPLTCFGRLDLSTGRVSLIEHSYPAKDAGRPPGAKDMPWAAFAYIGDETQALSCAPGRLFSNHQGSVGMLDLQTGRVASLFGKRDSYGGFYGPANFGWENQGGVERAAAAGQPYGLVNEWHGPARGIASVAAGRVYFSTGSQVLCFEAEERASTSQRDSKEDRLIARKPFVPTAQYSTQHLAGWTVRINQELLNERAEIGRDALALLETKLREIRRLVPPRALEAIERVPIWLGVDDYALPNATYHPSEQWLRTHGWNPDKARCVEISNAAVFVEWSRDQPMIVLHELAHAYHHQVLGHAYAAIRAAYENAKASRRYEKVRRGAKGTARAYALNNDQEFFAEASEAYFGRNDFYPFTRGELKEFDPETFRVVEEAWHR